MRRPIGWTALALGAALALGGCAGAPELDPDRAATLQDSVLAVTQAAAESRWADAQGLLTQTRTVLDEGADSGEVSTARYRQIDAALDAVEAEVAAALAAAQQAAAEQAAAEKAEADRIAAEQLAAEQAAAEKAAAERAAAEQKEPPAEKGPPKGKGKDDD